MSYAIRCFILGLLVSLLVYLAERTTGQPLGFPSWLLIGSFPVAWAIVGYLAWRWELGGVRSKEREP